MKTDNVLLVIFWYENVHNITYLLLANATERLGLGCLMPHPTIFQLYHGGNRNTRRKPLTCRKSLTNLITKCCFEYTSPWKDFELTTSVVIGTGSCKYNYHTITTTTTTTTVPSYIMCIYLLQTSTSTS